MLHSGYSVFVFLIFLEICSSRIANSLTYLTLFRIYTRVLSTKPFEKDGQFYQEVFRVKLWKDYVPAFGTFDKKHMSLKVSSEYLSVYLLESVRAELVHYLCLLFVSGFLLFTSLPGERFFWSFFALINFPCIIIQRYNRPRFERILKMRHEELVVPDEDSDFLKERRKPHFN